MVSSDLSPYDAATSSLFYSRLAHFNAAAEVWEAFFTKQISAVRREALLRVLRDRLATIPLEK